MPVPNLKYIIAIPTDDQTLYLAGYGPSGTPAVTPDIDRAGAFDNAMDAIGDASYLGNGATPQIKPTPKPNETV